MRTLAFWGMASTFALLSMALAGSADSAPARSTMSTGTAQSTPSAQNWGNVPEVGLRPPTEAPAPGRGGWGPGGWQGGDSPPPGVAPGGPSTAPNGSTSSSTMIVSGAPDDRGRPGDWRDDRGARDGGWRGRTGDGPYYGSGRAGWSGRYNRLDRGYVVPGYLRAPNFNVSNWWAYGLAQPAYGQSWIRYYDDALLIDGNGRVVDTFYDLDWDRPAPPPEYTDYGDGDDYEPGNYDRGFRDDGVRVYRSGPNAPEVTVHRRDDGSTVVVIPSTPTPGTTTTTYYDEPVTTRRTVTTTRRTTRPRRR